VKQICFAIYVTDHNGPSTGKISADSVSGRWQCAHTGYIDGTQCLHTSFMALRQQYYIISFLYEKKNEIFLNPVQ
jgi:hypothetical protein